MSNQIVRTFGLSKRYGDSLSVSNLDMTVSEGKIYGFWDQTEREKHHA